MKEKTPILISYPDKDITQKIYSLLRMAGYPVECCLGLKPRFDELSKGCYALLIVDEREPWTNDSSIFNSIQTAPLPVPVIFLAETADIRRAVDSIKFGACDYFALPVDEALLLASVARALSRSIEKKPPLRTRPENKHTMIARSQGMQQVISVVKRVADSSATVLIQGESGTGKEVLARYIHYHSKRSQQPFVAMNCAALPDALAESELFGYEKGAFTGAIKTRMGRFEQAQNGTLLLDEISEMPLPMQAKLLRVLQEREVDPLGSQTTIRIDTRCIATSNQDLAEKVRQGKFREDLYYRLRVIPLTLPPLRNRKEDIDDLVAYFIDKHTPDGRAPLLSLDHEALSYLKGWHWPGNIRELENTIERALLIHDGPVIDKTALLLDQDMKGNGSERADALVGMTVRELEKKLIGQTLSHLNHNRTHAAKMLGISIRTLRNKLREYKTKQDQQHSVGSNR